MLSAALVKQAARDSGFGLVGIAPAGPLDPTRLRAWLGAGFHAGMRWMEERVEERLDPGKLQLGCRSVIALGCCFLTRAHVRSSPVALYAQGRDYHATMQDRLRKLRRKLLELSPSIRTYSAADTGPVMEREWARRAGLGWIGRNAMLTTPEHGSSVMLATMLIDQEVDAYDHPIESGCDGCDACIRACPTGALTRDGVDARRCLSCQTIEETNGRFAAELRPHSRLAFGCDCCQLACPHNDPSHACDDARFAPRPLASLKLEEIAALSPEQHRLLTQGTAVPRAHYDGLRRNALIALGAQRAPGCAEAATALLDDPSDIVRDAAAWALEQAPSASRQKPT
jgi:epoxyqueuosine reductase